MAQTVKEIQEIIKQKVYDAEELTPLDILTENEQDQITSTSRVSEWGRFIYVFAFIVYLQQKLFDAFKALVEKIIADNKIHSKDWYRQKALAYQHGYDLITDTDKYPKASDFNDQIVIDASKIVKQAAIVKRGNSILRCKIATEVNGNLSPVSNDVLNAFTVYMGEVSDAGTTVVSTTGDPDDLKIIVNIYFDALVLDNQGKRLDGTDTTPSQDATKSYLRSIVFNGKLIVNAMEKFIQQVEGVHEVDIEYCASKYGLHNYETVDVPNVGLINQFRTAEAGYMKLDELTSVFNFIPYDE